MDSSDESDGGFDPSKGAFRVNLDKRPSFSQLARRTVKIDASPRTARKCCASCTFGSAADTARTGSEVLQKAGSSWWVKSWIALS